MDTSISFDTNMTEQQNASIGKVVKDYSKRLSDFIRQRVDDTDDADDILQDVFFELTESYRLVKPIEQMSAWLFRVTRNKIIDRYRKHKPLSLESLQVQKTDDDNESLLEELLFITEDSPDKEFERELAWQAIENALDELPAEQREVFRMHEMEQKSFKEIAEITGVSVNTLISRKHYAVKFLRNKLSNLYNEFVENN